MTYAVSESWGLTGRAYRRLALDAADRAEQLDPALSAPYAVRGSVIFDMIGLGESDDWQTSISNLSEAIARDPKNATAWFWRGIDYLVLGFFDRAIADIGRCVEIDPAYAYCGKWLAFAHLLAGDEDKALLLYERSAEAAFSSEAAFAAAYIGRGDLRAANSILAAQYSDVPELVRALHRALTDPTFSNTDRRNALALIDEKRPATGSTAARFFLGDYSNVGNNINAGLWWYRGDERYLKSSERKAHMRRLHLPDYWRAHGFPTQCRPIGSDDFECD
jgi:tetratricopeptide (TPR) repeat protein